MNARRLLLRGGAVGGGSRLLGLGHLDVAQGVVAVEAVEVDIAADAAAMAFLGVLPQGEARGGIAAIVGDKDVVLGVLLDSEVGLVDALGGVNHGLDAILGLHELQQLVDALHVEAAGVVPFDVKHGDEVLLAFLDHLAHVGHLLVGGGLGAVDVVAADEEAGLAGRLEVGLIVGVLDGGAFGGADVDELDGGVFGHLGPVDGALELGDVDAACADLSLCAHGAQAQHQHDA